MLTYDETINFIEDTIRSLIEEMVPSTVDGHRISGGFKIDNEHTWVNIQFGFDFEPTEPRSGIKYHFGYAEGIPLSYFETGSLRIRFKTSMREVLKDMIINLITEILKMDKNARLLISTTR